MKTYAACLLIVVISTSSSSAHADSTATPRSVETSMGISLGTTAISGTAHVEMGLEGRYLRSRGRLAFGARASAWVLYHTTEADESTEGVAITVGADCRLRLARHNGRRASTTLWSEAGAAVGLGTTAVDGGFVGLELASAIGASLQFRDGYGDTRRSWGAFLVVRVTAPIAALEQRGWQFVAGWEWSR